MLQATTSFNTTIYLSNFLSKTAKLKSDNQSNLNMHIFNLFVIVILVTGNVCSAAYLRIIEAGVSGDKWGVGPALKGDTKLCGSDLFNKFTVECVPDDSEVNVSADFYLNAVFFRKERVAPYVLTGDGNQIANPWINYPQSAAIECRLSNGEKAEATVDFNCETGAALMASPPASVPEMPMEIANMKKSDDRPEEGCVKIPATEPYFKSGAWSVMGSAMAYKYNEESRATDRFGTSKLLYTFTAPVTSRYAFTLDWETAGGSDYNDVWVEFPAGGWTLQRRDSKKNVKGWIKAYQNFNGRATATYSVDFNPHSISTRKVLKKGSTYKVKVGGRSSKVKVYNIVMFPCHGQYCRISGYWNGALAKCMA